MTTSAAQLISTLEDLGVRLWVDGGRLRFRAPQGVMNEQTQAAVRGLRDEIIAHLDSGTPEIVPDPAARFDLFPVTDVQSAYLLGRGRTFPYGEVACHGYGELTYSTLDVSRMVSAWQALVRRHDMLRAVVNLDGSQQVLPDPPLLTVPVHDLRGRPIDEFEDAVRTTRAELDHRVADPTHWPLVEVRLTVHDLRSVVQVSIDFLVADFVSVQVILDEVHQLYTRPNVPLPALDITYRDYLAAERRWRAAHQDRDRAYWLDRLADLPPAPQLPVLASPPAPRFRRLAATLPAPVWERLRQQARDHGVSPATAGLAAYQEVIGAWSSRRFTLNVTVLNRLPLHPQVPALVGDFTSVSLLAREGDGATFADRARAAQDRLWQDIDHRAFSGVDVMREIARRDGADAALFPVVFTSAIGVATARPSGADTDPDTPAPTLGYGISQTPQVWIDCQNIERGGGLATNWDVREGVLPPELVEDAFATYEALLRRLASSEAWQEREPVHLPAAQARRRAAANATAGPVPAGRLHDRFLEQARRTPDRFAVIGGDRAMTYGELLVRAYGVADALVTAGCRPGDLVGITLDRGCDQVVAVLGTLVAGAAYVPIDPIHPAERRRRMLGGAGIRLVLTSTPLTGERLPADVTPIVVATLPPAAQPPATPVAQPDDLAYVIHTSGSTGVPKGVMISHRAALNTVIDVTSRFGVGPDDRLLGLSQLGFDLSVYDVFGPLSCGGCLVIPAPDRGGDPSHWAALIAEHRVTVWNSVPAQMQMLVELLTAAPVAGLDSLRLALLSGDWIPVTLPDTLRGHLPGVRIVSLGGATEAAIWSTFHPIERVDPAWPSIPYGRPLTNQTFHVLDERMRSRPDFVPGELFIGGLGVARGYLGDEQRTAERFPRHPETGERLYRTGDRGRYLPTGDIEFLGREDLQVKIRGHRIELAEVEAALVTHPAVGRAVAIAAGDPPLERRLAAFVEPVHRPEPDPGERATARAVEAAAGMAGGAATQGVDLHAYLAFTARLDRAALPGMVRALQALGLFTTTTEVHPPDQIAAVAGPKLRLVRRWVGALTAEGLLELSGSGLRLSRPVDQSTVDDAWRAVAEVAGPDDADLLDYFRANITQLPALLTGGGDPLALLFPRGQVDVSRRLYEDAVFNRWANAAAGGAVRQISRDRPDGAPLRVLEVGAGAGGTTAAVLAALAGIDVDYLCTDLSPYFLARSRERFGDRPGLRWAAFDLDSPAQAQGLQPNSFDVVVAGDVLHASTDIDRALRTVSALLAPGGWLVALEMTRDHYQIMTSLELLVRLDQTVGDFTDERRGTDRTFLDRRSWARALARAGGTSGVCLPAGDQIAELGMGLFAARFKADRAVTSAAELTDHLRERLPSYMIPPVIQVVDALPLTDNGKVDRKALLGWIPRPSAADPVRDEGSPAGSELERQVAAIWAAALGLPAVALDANLFTLGGDSLISARIAGQIKAEVPEAEGLYFDELLRELLERPTVTQLAGWIAAAGAARSGTSSSAAAEPGPGDLPPAEPPVAAESSRQLVTLQARPGGHAPPLVLVHDCAGSLDLWRPLVSAATDRVIRGLTVTDLRAECGAPLSLERLAADHARAVAAAHAGPVRLVGYGYAALLALEVGRALADGGHAVDAVVLVAGRPARGPLDPASIGVAFEEETGRAPADDELAAFAALYRALAGHRPTLYAGDVVLLRPADDQGASEFWEDLCLEPALLVDLPLPRHDLAADAATVTVALGDARTGP